MDPHNKKICKTLGSPQKKSLKLPFSGRSCPGGIMFFFTFFFSSIFPMKGRDQEICQRKLIQYNSITLYNSKKQTSINIISTQTHLPTSNSLRAIPTFFAKHPRPSETMPFPSPGFATWTDSVMRTKSKTNPSGRDQTTWWGGLKLRLPLLAPPGCPSLPFLTNRLVVPRKNPILNYWVIYDVVRLSHLSASARF